MHNLCTSICAHLMLIVVPVTFVDLDNSVVTIFAENHQFDDLKSGEVFLSNSPDSYNCVSSTVCIDLRLHVLRPEAPTPPAHQKRGPLCADGPAVRGAGLVLGGGALFG